MDINEIKPKELGDRLRNEEFNAVVNAVKKNAQDIEGVAGSFQGDVVPSFNFTNAPKGIYAPLESGNYGGPVEDGGVVVDLETYPLTEIIWNGSYLSKKAEVEIVVPSVETVSIINPEGEGIPTEKAVADYAPEKSDTEDVVWGISDESKDRLAMYLDKDLKLHTTIHPDSYPPQILHAKSSNYFDFAVADSGDFVIFGITKDGEYFPKINNSVDPEPDTTPAQLTYFEQRVQNGDVSKDGIWNQWIEPVGSVDIDGNVWVASIGELGNLYVTKRTPYGSARIRIGAARSLASGFKSDDHNAPAIVLDNRPDAEYPIIIFQCDHNTTQQRMWRFTSLDPTTWDVDSWTNVITGSMAYCQPHRYNDEIFLFARRAAQPRPWRLLHSIDNGNNWRSRDIFSSPATWLYMLTKMKEDGSGLNMGCVGHPINSSEQSIFFLELDFASGEVRSPTGGVVIADIRAAIDNPDFVPVDPFAVGMVVYQAQGTESCRMWDVSRGTDQVSVVFSVFPSLATTMSNFNNSVYKAVTFYTSDGTINRETDMGECGMPIENPKGHNFYVAGACLLDNDNALLCAWRNQSSIDGGGDTTIDYGKTWLDSYDLQNDVKKEIFVSDRKLIRPFAIAGGEYVALCEAEKFITYDDFRSNVLLINKKDFNI